jgi:hypothetical protein
MGHSAAMAESSGCQISNAMQIFREHADVIRRGERDYAQQSTPEFRAAYEAYLKSAGEVEAKNAVERLIKGAYRKHPFETMSVPAKDQIVRDPDIQRRTFFDAIRRGFRQR